MVALLSVELFVAAVAADCKQNPEGEEDDEEEEEGAAGFSCQNKVLILLLHKHLLRCTQVVLPSLLLGFYFAVVQPQCWGGGGTLKENDISL